MQEKYTELIENILEAQEYLTGGPMTEVSYYNDECAKQLLLIREIMLSQGLTFPEMYDNKIILLLSDSMAGKVTKDMQDKELSLKIKVAHDLCSTDDLLNFYSKQL